jgi:photosystem II stability/assembly factor-like uncharacterized protein
MTNIAKLILAAIVPIMFLGVIPDRGETASKPIPKVNKDSGMILDGEVNHAGTSNIGSIGPYVVAAGSFDEESCAAQSSLSSNSAESNLIVQKQHEETSYYLRDIDFFDSNVGWAVGAAHWDQAAKTYKGTIIKTLNGGDTWTAQKAGVTVVLYGVYFVNANKGWVVGENGTILHTDDGGSTWTGQTAATAAKFRGVFFSDVNNGWATATQPIHYDIWGDPDNWEASIWHTGNGGQTWVEQSIPTSASILRRIQFVDLQKGWAVGVKYIGDDEIGHPQHQPCVYHTIDGGQTWAEQFSPDTDITFTAVDFIDANTGWVAGFKTSGAPEGGVVFHTTNGGTSWEQQNGGENIFDHIEDIHFLDLNKGYAAGFNPLGGTCLWRTLNNGTTWQEMDVNNQSDGEFLYGVAVNGGRVVAVGDHDLMAISTDPWGTYEPPFSDSLFNLMYLNIHYRFEDVFFADANHGWAVGRRTFLPDVWGQVIFSTQDGGLTWLSQYEKAPPEGCTFSRFRLDSVYFTDLLNGWAVGKPETWYDAGWSKGAILHTADGGLHWEEQGDELGGIYEFFAVQFLDPLNGWALNPGHYGGPYPYPRTIFLAHTIDGGVNWAWVDSGIEGDLSVGGEDVQGDLVFTDSLHGWAVGGLGEVIHTEDGGINWVKQDLTCGWPSCPIRLYAVEFLNDHEGWIAGEGLYHTTDGGNNWLPDENISDKPDFQDIQFLDANNGWIAGNSGILGYTYNGGGIWNFIESGSAASLRGISFVDPERGWLVGDYGTILKVSKPISVTSPNGMEKWHKGILYKITWICENVIGDVSIELYKEDVKVKDIATIAASSGTYSWKVPMDLTAGDDYKIRIFQGSIEDYSDNVFTIDKKVLNMEILLLLLD